MVSLFYFASSHHSFAVYIWSLKSLICLSVDEYKNLIDKYESVKSVFEKKMTDSCQVCNKICCVLFFCNGTGVFEA